MPTAHSEAERWAPSSWQRERQLAQEGRSQGADCWERVSWIVSDTGPLAAGCSWEGPLPSLALALPPKFLQLEINLRRVSGTLSPALQVAGFARGGQESRRA